MQYRPATRSGIIDIEIKEARRILVDQDLVVRDRPPTSLVFELDMQIPGSAGTGYELFLFYRPQGFLSRIAVLTLVKGQAHGIGSSGQIPLETNLTLTIPEILIRVRARTHDRLDPFFAINLRSSFFSFLRLFLGRFLCRHPALRCFFLRDYRIAAAAHASKDIRTDAIVGQHGTGCETHLRNACPLGLERDIDHIAGRALERLRVAAAKAHATAARAGLGRPEEESRAFGNAGNLQDILVIYNSPFCRIDLIITAADPHPHLECGTDRIGARGRREEERGSRGLRPRYRKQHQIAC